MKPTNSNRKMQILVDFHRHWSLLTRPGIAYSVILAALTGFTFQAISSFFPTFLVEFHSLNTGIAGIVFSVLFGLSAVAQPTAGWLSDRYSRDVALSMSIGFSVTGLVILLVVPNTVGLAFGVGFLGIGISWPGVIQARILDMLSEVERGYGYGLIRTTYMLLASTSSLIVGLLVDLRGWVYGIGSLLLVLCVCFLLIGFYKFFDN